MAESYQVKLTAAGALAARAADLLRRTVGERTGLGPGDGQADFTVRLGFSDTVPAEGFRIEDAPGGVRITGGDGRGVLYGVGKFLRTSRLEPGRFTPGDWRGESIPVKPVRGMYFATHFHNFYHDGPIELIQRYIEELALWGCNALSVWFDMHHFNGMQDPAAQAMVRRLRRILQTATSVGMGAGLTTLSNEGFADSPEELRADGNAGQNGYFKEPRSFYWREICPSKPGGMAEILRERARVLDAFADLDIEYVWLWPYDQGGCTCAGCAPWGVNGHLRCGEAVSELVQDRWPDAGIVLSTWYFDHFVSGEWEGLAEAFADGPPGWPDYLLTDDYGGFPEWPRKQGIPGGLPAVSFPEISMCGNFPWGGYGAHPAPAHWQEYWEDCRHLLAGSFPYSEGIYEDLSKVILLQLCWAPERPVRDIVTEYLGRYIHDSGARDAAVSAVYNLEAAGEHSLHPDFKALIGRLKQTGMPLEKSELFETRLYDVQRPEKSVRAARELSAAEGHMPPWARAEWRWRMLRLRAELGAAIRESGGVPSERTEELFAEVRATSRADTAGWQVSVPDATTVFRVFGLHADSE